MLKIKLLVIILISFTPFFSYGKEYKVDVCVYGGNASGMMAAISASQRNKSVVVIEPSRWLGGFIGGGSRVLRDCVYADDIGEITSSLNLIEKAEKLNVVISLEGSKYRNEYDIWVYPKVVDTSIPEGILVTDQLDSKTRKHLQSGGKAIIIPEHDKLTHCINGAFQTDYWCYPMFARAAIKRGIEPAPGSLGFICDPDSPLLELFPTEFHSNWQWWQLVKNCKPIILDDTPADYKPLVQTIDNFARNHKLGMIFETKYGKGSALICAIDLLNLQDKPEARQLYYSILNYVNSENFSPENELSEDVLNRT